MKLELGYNIASNVALFDSPPTLGSYSVVLRGDRQPSAKSFLLAARLSTLAPLVGYGAQVLDR